MKPAPTWDYTHLAKTYDQRAPYAPSLVQRLCAQCGIDHQSFIADIGAGTGMLTYELSQTGAQIMAIEPNQAMRDIGIRKNQAHSQVEWRQGTAEHTGLDADSVDLVSFGSSFNVVQTNLALAEAQRIVRSGGWLLLLWNHRDLSTGLQAQIEQRIQALLPDYRYGSRRADQTPVLEASGLFASIQQETTPFTHTQTKTEVMAAWRSHGTLQRQAGSQFQSVLNEIENQLQAEPGDVIHTPFTTRSWLAQYK